MAPMSEVQAHESVAGTKDCHFNGEVGLSTRMGLDIGIFGTVNGLDSINSELLDLIDYFAASVVALAGISFGVFIGTYGAHSLHYLGGNIVF